ncbi:MAG: hypothetical protein NZ473_05730 [Candidatus Kapabacteria bacterium]|nr:hypothetical protein [Candidatus Kapabacteria bacterium]
MRVSWGTRFQTAEAGIRRLQQQLTQVQQQLATGKRLNSLADDPVAFGSAYRLRELVDTTEGRLRTLQAMIEESRVVQTHAEALSRVLQEVQTLIAEALDPKHLDKPAFLAEHLRQRLEDILGIANAQYHGRYLFSGTRTTFADGRPAFQLQQASPTSGNLSGLSVEFRGTLAQRRLDLFPGQEEILSLCADELFGANGTELFTVLIEAYNLLAYRSDGSRRQPEESLSVAERNQVEEFLPRVAAFVREVDRAIARAGFRQARWELLQQQLQEFVTQIRAFHSAIADVDLARVALELQQTQTALQAVLQSSARVLGLSLFDFLR